MYQALLTRRYLTSKVMPLLASVAVTLCTAMVLIVWSVMGGFLNALLAQGSSIIGDVSISRPGIGLPHYEAFIDELEARPEIARVTPTIETLGLLALPGGKTKVVQVIGVRPDELNEVTRFHDNLWWRPVEPPDTPSEDDDWRTDASYAQTFERLLEFGQSLRVLDPVTGVEEPAMVLGIEVSDHNLRRPDGTYAPLRFEPMKRYTISVLPMSRRGVTIELESRAFTVANEYRSGMYNADSTWVFLPFDTLQSMLKLDEAQRVPDTFTPGEVVTGPDGIPTVRLPQATETTPARATTMLVRAVDGVTPREAEAVAEEVYLDFAERHTDWPLDSSGLWRENNVYVWEEKPDLRQFIAAVRKETGLVLVLFVFISITAVFLVGAIFWSMVSEKTRDIGVLRAVGASAPGVAWLFVRYGLAIGIVGSITGGALAWVIIDNINAIHEWLGSALGLYIWDPSVYYFTEIPARIEPQRAAIVLGGGVFFSALGALIPAARAAHMHPVRALRFE